MKRRLTLFAVALLLLLTACNGPAEESVPPETRKEGSRPVYTDWSKLEPHRADEGLYTRYYDRPVDRLLAVEGGYGEPLIGFIGSLQRGADGWGGVVKYGVATADGTVVCDPVYSSVCTENGRLILGRTDLTGNGSWDAQDRVTVAAPDGSWVLQSEYRGAWSLSDGRLLLADTAGGVWLCDRNGTLEQSPLMDAFSRREEAAWSEAVLSWSSFYDGTGVFQDPEGRGSWLLNAVTGEVKHLPDVMYCYGWPDGDPLAVALSVDEKWGYLDRNGEWVIPPRFRWAGDFEGDCAEAELDEESGLANLLIDRSGQVVARMHGSAYTASDRSGTVYYLDVDYMLDRDKAMIIGVYDGTGKLLPDHPLVGREAAVHNYAVTTAEDQAVGNSTVRGGLMTVWDYDGTVLGTVEGAQDLFLQSCENGKAVLSRWGALNRAGVYDLAAGVWIVPLEDYWSIRVRTDGMDTVYVCLTKGADGYDILREDGTFVAHVDIFEDFTRGLLQCERGDAAVWLDLTGAEVFRWPIQSNSD